MMRGMTKVLCGLLAAVCVFLSAGCAHSDVEGPGKNAPGCIIDGKSFSFVSVDEKKQWIEPLTKLLANELTMYGEYGEILGYKAPDPDSPAVEQYSRCGLLDVTMDGVPELLIFPLGGGGSAGNAFYYIYDIYTGKRIGNINGGWDDSWCVYYFTESDELRLVGQYQWRCGWSTKERFIDLITYDEKKSEYRPESYLYAEYEIGGKMGEVIDGNADDDIYTGTWIETYSVTDYKIRGESVDLDSYYTEYDRFVNECIRIHETSLRLVEKDSVAGKDDDRTASARKLAEALVSSGQEFIKPEK